MSDDFEKLSGLTPPKASAEARARALTAAMQAFDERQENSTATQGSVQPVRQSSIFNRIWSPIMNRKLLAGSALATLLVVPAAAFLTLELTRNGAPFGESAQEIALKDEAKKEVQRQRPEPQMAAKKAATDELARQREAKPWRRPPAQRWRARPQRPLRMQWPTALRATAPPRCRPSVACSRR